MKHRLDNTESAIPYGILSNIIKKSELTSEEIDNLYDLNNTNPEKFINDIKNSLELNKDLKTSDIARILGKHCKTNYQSNTSKKRKIYSEYILKILEKYNIKEYMCQERTIHLFLDKYSSNRSNLVKSVAKLLKINLIYLPPYSPHLNPIEQVWRLIKRELKHHYIYSEDYMKHITIKEFYIQVLNFSILEEWYEKYITIVW